MAAEEEKLSEQALVDLKSVIWSASNTSEDVRRWHDQGFILCERESLRFGLRQRSGGPCGILTPVQAWMLCDLMFGFSSKQTVGEVEGLHPTSERARLALARSLAVVLCRAAPDSPLGTEEAFGSWSELEAKGSDIDVVLVIPNAAPFPPEAPAAHFRLRRVRGLAAVTETMLSMLGTLEAASGVMQYLYSLLLTRGPARVREEMDDTEALVGRCVPCAMPCAFTSCA